MNSVAFGLATAVVNILPQLISAGIDVADLLTNTHRVIDTNKGPANPEWDELDAKVNALRADLHRDVQS